MKALVFAIATNVVLAFGCGGKSNPAEAAADASSDAIADSPRDARGDSDADAVFCHDQPNLGRAVEPNYVPEDMPVGTGGVVRDGTYLLTSDVTYTGVGGKSGKRGDTVSVTLTVSGSSFRMTLNVSGGKETRSSGTLSTTGTALTLQFACPAAAEGRFESYEVSDKSLRLFDTDTKSVLTYTLGP